jgi:hypothetical protein
MLLMPRLSAIDHAIYHATDDFEPKRKYQRVRAKPQAQSSSENRL